MEISLFLTITNPEIKFLFLKMLYKCLVVVNTLRKHIVHYIFVTSTSYFKKSNLKKKNLRNIQNNGNVKCT